MVSMVGSILGVDDGLSGAGDDVSKRAEEQDVDVDGHDCLSVSFFLFSSYTQVESPNGKPSLGSLAHLCAIPIWGDEWVGLSAWVQSNVQVI